ncbi:MAG: DNA-binding protein [Lachnospiraceae bacterium]|nr:DNA-binding protein [Lachnospiraceae bacterium]
MDKAAKIKELRESTGMNRKEFCEYFKIPYRTMSEWERDGRHAPDYLIRLLDYYIRVEMLKQKEATNDPDAESTTEREGNNHA